MKQSTRYFVAAVLTIVVGRIIVFHNTIVYWTCFPLFFAATMATIFFAYAEGLIEKVRKGKDMTFYKMPITVTLLSITGILLIMVIVQGFYLFS